MFAYKLSRKFPFIKKNNKNLWKDNQRENNDLHDRDLWNDDNNPTFNQQQDNAVIPKSWNKDKNIKYEINNFTIFTSYQSYKETFEKLYSLYKKNNYIFNFIEAHAVSYAGLFDNTRDYNRNRDMCLWRRSQYEEDFKHWFDILNEISFNELNCIYLYLGFDDLLSWAKT